MGYGFYLMIAAAIVMYKIAEADHRRGWLWFGITLCATMVLSKAAKLGISAVFIGFIIVFLGMYIANLFSNSD